MVPNVILQSKNLEKLILKNYIYIINIFKLTIILNIINEK